MASPLNTKSIFIDIALTVLTLGLFNIWVQLRQIYQINVLVSEEEQYSALILFLLLILTLGLYLIWHEFSMTRTLNKRLYGKPQTEIEVLCGVGTFFGLWFIVDSYQQHLLNLIIES